MSNERIILFFFMLFAIITVSSTIALFNYRKTVTVRAVISTEDQTRFVAKDFDRGFTSPIPTLILYDNLSINSLFRYRDPLQSLENKDDQTYTIIATGDVIPARSVNAKVVGLNDFTFPFKKTADFLKRADAVFINLESPLIPNCPVTIEGMIFCGDRGNVQGLTYANVSVVSIANNHMANYGLKGIGETVALLKRNNIAVTGNGESAILTIKEKRFGFLGYNDVENFAGIASADVNQIILDVSELKKDVDFVIVAFHWGIEYVSDPTQRQRELAHAAIDAGADLVIGNHPHWVQGIEQYKEKFITYAHGNFIFDQMWSRQTREGVLGKYIFNDTGLIDVQFYPVIIDDYSQPRFATQIEAEIILSRMRKSTEEITLR